MRSNPKAFSAGWSILALVGLAVFYIVPANAYLLYYAITQHVRLDPKHPELAFPAEVQLIAQVITYLPVALYLLFVLPPLARGTLASLGIRRPTGSDAVIGLAGAGATWIVTSALATAIEKLTHQKSTEAAIALLSSLSGEVEKIVFAVVAVILAPLIEELIFRVFLLNAIRRYAPAGVAIVVSSLLFGVVHVTAANQLLTVGLPLAGSGIVFGYVYVRTNNYWTSVIAHAAFNGTNVIALLFFGANA